MAAEPALTRRAAAAVVSSVAHQLSDPDTVVARWEARGSASLPWSLGSGYPGMALLYAELSATDPQHRPALHRWLQRSNAVLDQAPAHSLYLGVPALTYAVRRAATATGGYVNALSRLEARTARIVQTVVERETARMSTGGRCVSISDYDVLSGLAGVGVEALEHRDTATAARVATALTGLAQPIAVGDTTLVGWWTAQESESYEPTTAMGGHANLGMAHGLPGPLSMLALAWAGGVRVPGQPDAMATMARWLMEQRRTDAMGSCWPVARTYGDDPVSTRPSWCYGAPAIGMALHHVGAALEVGEWRDTGLDAVRAAVSRPHGLRSAGLCHGLAGLLHVVHRMAVQTGDETLWSSLPGLAAELAQKMTDFRLDRAAGAAEWDGINDDMGFLTGIAGAALALHTYATGAEPRTRWDRALLLA